MAKSKIDLIKITTAVAAIAQGQASVAQVVEAALEARTAPEWHRFGGELAGAELAAFWAVKKALPTSSPRQMTDEELEALDRAERAVAAEQARLDDPWSR